MAASAWSSSPKGPAGGASGAGVLAARCGGGAVGAVGLLDDRDVQAAAVGQLGELPALAGLDFEQRLQRPARRFDERHAREIDRLVRAGCGGSGEDPADVQARVFAGGRPGRRDGFAESLGQERQDRVWRHAGRATQQARLSGRLTGTGP
jgi:hypothetical protein